MLLDASCSSKHLNSTDLSPKFKVKEKIQKQLLHQTSPQKQSKDRREKITFEANLGIRKNVNAQMKEKNKINL